MPHTARHLATTALAAGAAALLVVGTAAPGSAGSNKGAGSTGYATSWNLEGGVDGILTAGQSGLQLTDYTGTTYYDRVTGAHAGTDSVTVDGNPCRHTSKDPAGVSLYGAEKDWAQMPIGSTQGARVNISCVIDGAHHRFHWGNHGTSNGGYDPALTTNCVDLKRQDATTFLLDTKRCEVTQDVVYNGRLQQVGDASFKVIPFTATVTVPGLK